LLYNWMGVGVLVVAITVISVGNAT